MHGEQFSRRASTITWLSYHFYIQLHAIEQVQHYNGRKVTVLWKKPVTGLEFKCNSDSGETPRKHLQLKASRIP
jgi:outer membrane lipoprotein-sorting protein